jgi:hypothetical protein
LIETSVTRDPQRQCGDGAYAGDCRQPLTDSLGFVRGGQFDFDFLDPGAEIRDLLAQ